MFISLFTHFLLKLDLTNIYFKTYYISLSPTEMKIKRKSRIAFNLD